MARQLDLLSWLHLKRTHCSKIIGRQGSHEVGGSFKLFKDIFDKPASWLCLLVFISDAKRIDQKPERLTSCQRCCILRAGKN